MILVSPFSIFNSLVQHVFLVEKEKDELIFLDGDNLDFQKKKTKRISIS